MTDGPDTDGRPDVRGALGTGAAALVLIVGTITILLGLLLVLKLWGYGVMLLVAVGGLLLFGAIVDVRRKLKKGSDAN